MLPPYLVQKINMCIQNVGMGFWMRYSFKMVLLQEEISILVATKLHNCITSGTNYSLGSFIWRDLATWSNILSNNKKYKILKNCWSKMPSLYMHTVNFASNQRTITVLFKNNITQIFIQIHAEARQICKWYLIVVLGIHTKWWEDMENIKSQEDFDEQFLKAGDKLTLAHFFSPNCRACKALHSKVKEEKYAHCTFNNFTIIKRRKKCMSCINLHWYRVPFIKCPQRYINLPGCIQDCNLLWSTIMNRLRSVRGSMSMSCHCSAFTEVLKVKYVASAALFQP